MGDFGEGVVGALRLLLAGDLQTWSAVIATLKVSSLSTAASLAVGIPFGFLLGYAEFPGRRVLQAVVDTLLALPTVVVGLFAYVLLSRRGPLGSLGLLFTIPGIAVAQTILVVPIVASLSAAAIRGLDPRLRPTLLTLGARGPRVALACLAEAWPGVLAAGVTAYGRALSEVGVSMMIGGNIKWRTRTITTAMALETGRGEFAVAMALGIVLLIIALLVNLALVLLRQRRL